MKRFRILLLFLVDMITLPLSQEIREKGFVYLHEIDPTILVSLRYYSNENFVGKTVDGYRKEVVVLTNQAARAIKEIQKEVNKDGFCLVVYDAYRPQKAVNNFMKWAYDITDQNKRVQYYPRIDKAKVFDLGYIYKRSGHSRGSTVDVTIIKKDKKLHKVISSKRKLLDGFEIEFLDDGTVDMGSSFDLFDAASHYDNNLIPEKYKKARKYLKSVMEKHGFKNLAEEWWHFTLINEPFAAHLDSSYFDFDVE